MTASQPDYTDLLRDHAPGWEDDTTTFRVPGGVGVPIPRQVMPTLLSASGMPLGLIGRPQLQMRPAWHKDVDPITGQTSYVLCFRCAEPVW